MVKVQEGREFGRDRRSRGKGKEGVSGVVGR